MRVANIHARQFTAAAPAVGALIDSLASPNDRLWPLKHWPPMRLDRPMGIGAAGGHGPIGYVVEACEPGMRIRFRFIRPRGFDGYHEFRVVPLVGHGKTHLEHHLIMEARGPAAWAWLLVFRPLHDALIEDALAQAEHALSGSTAPRRWPVRVVLLRRLLRAMLTGRRRRARTA